MTALSDHENLSDEDEVVRYVSAAKIRRDENDNVLGINPQAFEMKPKEKPMSVISVTHLNHFLGSRDEQIKSAINVMRTNLKTSKRSGYAVGKVGLIKNAFNQSERKIRIVYAPSKSNCAHSQIRRFSDDDLKLLELLASDVWSELVLEIDVDATSTKPPCQCLDVTLKKVDG